MQRYNLIPQEKKRYCVCSVLQAIFDFHGIKVSQDEIALKLNSGKRGGLYIHDEKMRSLMLGMGFNYSFFKYNKTPFNEPDMLLRDMAEEHGIIGIENHLYLLEEFKDPVLTLIDPEGDAEIKRDLYDVISEMERSTGIFGLVKKLDTQI